MLYNCKPGTIKLLSSQLPSTKNQQLFEEDVDLIGLVHNEDDLKKRYEGYHKHSFNVLISDRIGLHRDIPDTRDVRY